MGVVVVGATGFLGRRFAQGCSLGTSRRGGQGLLELDLASELPASLNDALEGQEELLLLAAQARIGACAADPEGTRRVNVEGTLRLAARALELGLRVVFFSSDYVFGGQRGGWSEDDPPAPGTEYGRQKREVEETLLALAPERVLIVRLSKVYACEAGGGGLLDEISLALRGGTYRAARDQVFCPTWVGDVTVGVAALRNAKASGVVHLCAPAPRSRLEIARGLSELLGVGRVVETSLAELGLGERPGDTSLRSERLRELVPSLDSFLTLEEGLARYALSWKGADR